MSPFYLSLCIGTFTFIILYAFDIFSFRQNINRIFCCCCYKNKENTITYDDNKELRSDIIVKKCGLLILRHPYGKGGIQGFKKTNFYVLFNNYQRMFNNNGYMEYYNENNDDLVNEIYEYKGKGEVKNITNYNIQMPTDLVDKRIVYKYISMIS